jgi:hypothetical protein
MKKFKDLSRTDFPFPNLNSIKFAEWKAARQRADSLSLWALVGAIILGSALVSQFPNVSPLTFSVPLVFILVPIVAFALWQKPLRLAKELGINRKSIVRARDPIKQTDYPDVPSLAFANWREAVYARRKWAWILGIVCFIFRPNALRLFFPDPFATIVFAMLLLSLVILVLRPQYIAWKLKIPKQKQNPVIVQEESE